MADAPIGRETEFAAVVDLLGARSGLPAGLVLEGEAGIGKTTLWLAAIRTAQDQGVRVLSSRPGPADALVSFAGIGDLLGAGLDEILPDLRGPQRRALETALQLADAGRDPPDQGAIAFAILAALRSVAGRSPVLIALDDLQSLDRPSAWALEFAFRRLRGEPVRILATVRATGEVTPAWLDSALPDAVTRIHLGPLSLGAIHQVLVTRLGTAFSRPTLRRIQELSRGNPLHALEVGRAMLQRGGKIEPGQPIPVRLDDLLRERVAALPEDTAAALLVASAVSEPTLQLLESATGGEVNLGPALETGLIELEDNRVRFDHPLLASAIYEQAGPERRRDVHRRLASVVTNPEEQARHLALGTVDPDPAVVAVLDRAAESARRRGTPSSSAELFEHALRLTEPDDPARARRAIEAADAHFEAGDSGLAFSRLERLIASLPSGGDRGRALWRLAALKGELESAAMTVVLYEEALAESGGDDDLVARINSELAWMTLFTHDVARAAGHAHTAVEHAEMSGRVDVLGESLAALAFVEFVAGLPPRPAVIDRALVLERRSERIRIDRSPSIVHGLQLMWQGELDAARPIFEGLLRAATERGDDSNVSGPGFYLGTLETLAGNWGRADEILQDAALLAEQTGVNRVEIAYAGALLDAHRGRVDQATVAAKRGLDASDGSPEKLYLLRNLAVLGFIDLSRGDPAGACAWLTRAAQLAGEMGIGDPGLLRFAVDQAEALVALGRPDDAAQALDVFERRARELGRAWAMAAAARSRGVIAAASGDVSGGLQLLAAAVAVQERLQMPFEHGRALFVLGQVQRRARQKRAARESLIAARSIFDHLGAALWAARAGAELKRISGRADRDGGLTVTERRVADLVAEGWSNREVAAQLFVTVRAVEANLSKIYAKLEIRSRGQLAGRLRSDAGDGSTD
jgi:DNA-binding CsgD family transcriptional regulator